MGAVTFFTLTRGGNGIPLNIQGCFFNGLQNFFLGARVLTIVTILLLETKILENYSIKFSFSRMRHNTRLCQDKKRVYFVFASEKF